MVAAVEVSHVLTFAGGLFPIMLAMLHRKPTSKSRFLIRKKVENSQKKADEKLPEEKVPTPNMEKLDYKNMSIEETIKLMQNE